VQSGAIGPDTFWSDDELLAHVVTGCRDLWRALVDLHQDHFVKIDTTVVLPTTSDTLTNVPADLFRILFLQPLEPNASGQRPIRFRRASLTSVDFTSAQLRSPIDVTGDAGIFYYAIVNAGSPVTRPEIYVAPQASGELALRLVYVPTLPGSLSVDSINPIPGESDQALMAWCAAYALGKQADGTFAPDTTWLSIYATEKDAIKIVSEPRDASTPSIVRGVFDDTIGPGLSGYGGLVDYDGWWW